ncbi:MAG: nitroreductase family protein [Chloroflexota bacterium]
MALWSLLDIGLLIENIALSAQGYGLGTCIEAVVVRFPDVLRKYVPIPESKRIVMGMAIGYPDFTAPVNKGWSTRLPLDAVSSWHGFGD